MDGWEMFVEGRRNGRVFRYFASNPDQCDDPGAIRGRKPVDILWE